MYSFGDVQSLDLNLPEQLYVQKGVGSLGRDQHCLINSHVLLSKEGSGLHFRKLQWLWDAKFNITRDTLDLNVRAKIEALCSGPAAAPTA